MTLRLAIAALLYFGVWSLGSAAVPAEQARFIPVREKIHDLISYWKVPSVAIAVSYHGQTIWEEGFGFADPEHKLPATKHTLYSLASVSKPITVTAIMVLVQKGKIKLDDPINRYLGDEQIVSRVGEAKDATIRRTASHTAGFLPHYQTFDADRAGRTPSAGEMARQFGMLVTPPGERFVYSNVGFGLLGRVVEKSSGQALGAYLKSAIYEPLGMHDTGFNLPVNETAGVAKRYFFGSQKLPDYEIDTPGSGSVFMSAHDLLRFGVFHLKGEVAGQTGPVLSRDAIAEMQKPVRLTDGSLNPDYALGWQIGQKHGLKWFGHDGGMSGVTTVVAVYPDADLVVVVLANGMSEDELTNSLQDDVVHVLLPATVAQDGGFVPAPAELGTWRGRIFRGNEPIAVEMNIHKDGGVSVRMGAGPEQPVLSSKRAAPAIHVEGVRAVLDESGTSRIPGQVEFTLTARKNHLSGYAAFNALFAFGDRWGSNLAYWTDLEKVE